MSTQKAAIFYHCLFYHGDPPELRSEALNIVKEQWDLVRSSGLEEAASEIIIGINGGEESEDVARLFFPSKAKLIMHGLQSKAENLTIVALEEWVKTHPDYYVFYHHSKGVTHRAGEPYGDNVSAPWRRAMMQDLVANWRTCIVDMAAGADSVGSHFMRGLADGTQNIWAGNFWWAKSSFLATVPTIFLRDRIKVSGISAAESRFEAEVWIGNGRLPIVKEYRPQGGGGVP